MDVHNNIRSTVHGPTNFYIPIFLHIKVVVFMEVFGQHLNSGFLYRYYDRVRLW